MLEAKHVQQRKYESAVTVVHTHNALEKAPELQKQDQELSSRLRQENKGTASGDWLGVCQPTKVRR